jgi:hypothetical protein
LLEAHICATPEGVNGFLFKAIKKPGWLEKGGSQMAVALRSIWGECPQLQEAKRLIFRSFSGALDIGAHRLGFVLDPLHPVLHQVADRDDSGELTPDQHRQMANPPLRHHR